MVKNITRPCFVVVTLCADEIERLKWRVGALTAKVRATVVSCEIYRDGKGPVAELWFEVPLGDRVAGDGGSGRAMFEDYVCDAASSWHETGTEGFLYRVEVR